MGVTFIELSGDVLALKPCEDLEKPPPLHSLLGRQEGEGHLSSTSMLNTLDLACSN